MPPPRREGMARRVEASYRAGRAYAVVDIVVSRRFRFVEIEEWRVLLGLSDQEVIDAVRRLKERAARARNPVAVTIPTVDRRPAVTV